MTFPVDLGEALAADAELMELARGTTIAFGLRDRGGPAVVLRFDDGAVTASGGRASDVAFALVLDAGEWARVLAAEPPPRSQHVLALLEPRGSGRIEGDAASFAQHLHLVRRVVEVARRSPSAPAPEQASLDDVLGRYLRVETTSWGTCDIYWESAGTGTPVIMLATAGSDSRQYHGLLTDARLTSQYRLIAFDLPWHGKSDPPRGRRNTEYSLDSDSYTGCIHAFIRALGLDQPPIVVGASMAGAAVVEMAARYPEDIAGAVGAQVGPRVANRLTPWLRNVSVNQALHVPEWTFGLMSPLSSKEERDRVWWGYSQGGFGIYEQDIRYYSHCWDIEHVRHLLTSASPPVVLMNGRYDYSVPPEATQELAGLIPTARYHEMPELGHFPHAENAAAFGEHLGWALADIDARRQTAAPEEEEPRA